MHERTVIIAGVTGLVGRELLAVLLADTSVVAVHSLGRRAPALQHPKLTANVLDFTTLPTLPHADEVYLALGTTIKDAGSQAAFRAVDFDANLAVAKAALAAGATRVGLVSAMGADANSRIFYSRVKGELEEALAQMPFQGLVIARPSMLLGNRQALGQRVRSGEVWATRLQRVVGWMIPANYQPIEAATVAQALLRTVPSAQGRTVLLSGSLKA
ncbi:nucleoside-diphosphate sugar epimerase [Hylemonella gracilis]|uniref:Nucleoside-diphosphate sugar epimerase n=1 Tax=Hylemonella gracilis TaxID=80880 RepID=A0A4P6UKA8_9BURK|nr:NAD(P)H-binding protein [Hylemonella gracilis]QBK05016.1 nucleoside-diphosphate sugar epimerase [Hylemonella gracilis]